MAFRSVLLALLCALPLVAAARGPDTDRQLDWLTPGSVPLPEGLPEDLTDTPAPAPAPALDIGVPDDVGLWGETTFRLARVELLGATVLDEAAVEALLRGFRDRTVTMSELQGLREALSRLYFESGYVSSGVIIPDQEIIDGVVRLQAIEGTLTTIEVRTDRRLRTDYVSGRVRRRISGPLDIGALQDTLVALQNDGRIARVDAELAPGTRRGDSVLRLAVVETAPWSVGLSFDNHRAESIGAERGRLSLAHGNLTGRGDMLALSADLTEGSEAAALSYTLPLAPNDATLTVYGSLDDSAVLDSPFDVLDIESRTDSYGFRLSAPLFETLRDRVALSVGFEKRTTTTRLLNSRFSLSPGALDGESAVAAFFAGLDYVHRGESQVLALRGTIRRGLDAFGATDAEDDDSIDGGLLDSDGQFTSVLLQGQYVRQLSPRVRLTLRSTAQLTANPLLAPEKLSIGGANTVRGYRENLLVRDNGVAMTAEVGHRPFPDAAARWRRDLTLVAFADYGAAWDEDDTAPGSRLRDTTRTNQILGLGLGLLWSPLEGLDLAAYAGFDVWDDFRTGEDPRASGSNAGLQNDGIHVSASWARRF